MHRSVRNVTHPTSGWRASRLRVVALALLVVASCMDPADPDPPATPTDAILLSQEVGTIPGALSAGLRGNALYQVPLAVPPGRAGLSPELTLAYDSQAGNGPLGVGFRLQGLSSTITRCVHWNDPTSSGRVELDARDRFCLDGEPLVILGDPEEYGADGSEYRTEVESVRRIVAHDRVDGAPGSFTVYAENDRILTYATRVSPQRVSYEDPSHPEPIDQGQVTVAWSLSRIEDRDGNAITFEYDTEYVSSDDVQGSAYYRHRVRSIVYTEGTELPAQKRVDFVYDDRPDPRDSYTNGTRERLDYRLIRIEMRGPTAEGDNRLTWSYLFGYSEPSITRRSLLATLQQCDAFGGCLPETRFSWSHGSLA